MDIAKIGFIGCGTHSTNNLYPMLAYARCRLDAVCDQREELARRNARIYGAEAVYTDAAKMLDERPLDGVMVVGPLPMHYEVGKQVLERGIPLFVEKPPAPTLAQAEELMTLAHANKTFLMTGFMKRHGLTYKKVRQWIDSGQLVPAAGFFQYGHWAGSDLNIMLLTMCIHPIDLAISFFGEVASVQSTLYRSEADAISLAVTLRFMSGRWTQMMFDSSQPRIQERVQISGTWDGGNALAIVDNVQQLELHRQGRNGIDFAEDMTAIDPDFDIGDIQMWRPDYGLPNMAQSRPFFQGFAGEVREFVNAILEKREPYPGTEDALKAMRVIDAILHNPDGTTQLTPAA